MKRFKPRPYDPSRRDERTTAQKQASARNFRIFQLRGLASFRYMLTGNRRQALLRLVDQELKAIGAEPESVRAERQRQQMEEDFS
jgi:uncharacterized protein YjiS (DUF1127 family)